MEDNNQPHEIIEKTVSAGGPYSRGGFFITIIALSLIFGIIGGYFGNILALKYKPNYSGSAFEQTVILTEDSAIIDVVKSDSPAVVSVVISKDLNKIPGFGSGSQNFDPFYFFFNGRQNLPRSNTPNIQQVGAGSGFFISEDGLIVTNKHVVEDEQASYTVITNEGKSYDATVLARDPVNDVAIMKIEIKNAPKLVLANSDEIQIGQRVVAIGNSLGQYQNTVTSGIVSGIGRSITAGGLTGSEELSGVIQTDAAINPGNSGGPLLNVTGQVIGINTAVDREGQLVGFAIPSNDIQRAVASFQKTGRITRPYMGIRYTMVTKTMALEQNLPRDYGVLIVRGQSAGDVAVVPGSPADKAGLKENDIILEINGKKLDEGIVLSGLLKNYNIGDVVTLKVYHNGEEKEVRVTLAESK